MVRLYFSNIGSFAFATLSIGGDLLDTSGLIMLSDTNQVDICCSLAVDLQS